MRLALGIEYDGTRFHGFQAQRSGIPTIEQYLIEALAFVAAEKSMTLACAGRTDAGVHATYQVVHFDTNAIRAPHSWVLGVNSRLPSDIAVQWAQPVGEDFHARFSAQRRYYRYIIYNHRSRSALYAHRATQVPLPLEAEFMAEAAQCLIGEHDFSAFRASECQAKSPVRRIDQLTVQRQGDFIIIEVVANAFLHHMVRNIVGSLMRIGHGKRPIEWLYSVLHSRDRVQAGATAPAQGLYLRFVEYPDQFDLPGATHKTS